MGSLLLICVLLGYVSFGKGASLSDFYGRGECYFSNGNYRHGETWSEGDSFEFRCNRGRVEFMGCKQNGNLHRPGTTWCANDGSGYSCEGSYESGWSMMPNSDNRCSSRCLPGTDCSSSNQGIDLGRTSSNRRGECFFSSQTDAGSYKQHGDRWNTQDTFEFRCNNGHVEFMGCRQSGSIYRPGSSLCRSGWEFHCDGSFGTGWSLNPAQPQRRCNCMTGTDCSQSNPTRTSTSRRGECFFSTQTEARTYKQHGDRWNSQDTFEFRCNNGKVEYLGCSGSSGAIYRSGSSLCRNGWEYHCGGDESGWSLMPAEPARRCI